MNQLTLLTLENLFKTRNGLLLAINREDKSMQL